MLLLAALAASVALGVTQNELALLLLREQLAYDALRIGFVLVALVGFAGLAVTLVVAPATRLVGTTAGVSLASAFVVLGYRHLRSPETLGPHDVAWVAAYALAPVLLDLVVGRYAARPLPLRPLLSAAAGVAVLELAVSLTQQLDYVGGVGNVLRDPGFYLTSVIVGPLLLLGGAAGGWLLARS